MVAFASSLDQAGPLAKTVEDAAILLTSMAGHDPKDSTSLDVHTPDFAGFVGRSPRGLRIGVPREYRLDGMPAEIERLVGAGNRLAEGRRLRGEGGEPASHPLRLARLLHHRAGRGLLQPRRATTACVFGLRAGSGPLTEVYEQSRAQGFGEEVKRRILIGTYVLSAGYYDAYYLKAQKVRRRIADDFDAVFEQVDALLTPTAPSAAFALGDRVSDPLAMYLNDVFTVTVNLAGLPGISVPAGLDAAGLPLGLQLIGRPLDEGTLFTLAGAVEQAAGFRAKPQPWVVKGRTGRRVWVASPFVLLALGGYALWRSPWPEIWRLMQKGAHVVVAYTWSTVGLPAFSLTCFAAAIVISLTIRRPR